MVIVITVHNVITVIAVIITVIDVTHGACRYRAECTP